MATGSSVGQFKPGDLVRVRGEDAPSVVVLPTDRDAESLPDDVPDLGDVCCVPVVLIRSPASVSGDSRWVELADVRLAEDLLSNAEAVEVGMWVQLLEKEPGFWVRVGAVARRGLPDGPVVLWLDWGCCSRFRLRLDPGDRIFALEAPLGVVDTAARTTFGGGDEEVVDES